MSLARTQQSDRQKSAVRAHLLGSADVKQQLADTCLDAVVRAAGLIVESLRRGGKIMLCGNGGSAADCQHVATEFVGRLYRNSRRPGLPAIALTTDSSFLTAHSNDVGFDAVFERQIEALGRPGDVLIAISTSGSSPNVVQGAALARSMGIATIALTGQGGRLAELADVAIAVPSPNSQHVQEAHIALEHVLCALVEDELYPATNGQTSLP